MHNATGINGERAELSKVGAPNSPELKSIIWFDQSKMARGQQAAIEA